jgi:hypothetical protein
MRMRSSAETERQRRIKKTMTDDKKTMTDLKNGSFLIYDTLLQRLYRQEMIEVQWEMCVRLHEVNVKDEYRTESVRQVRDRLESGRYELREGILG